MKTQDKKQQTTFANAPKQNTLYFKDGISKIDAVLVYKTENESSSEVNTFLKNLTTKGLRIESVPSQLDPSTIFAKIHAPHDALVKYANKYDTSFRKDQSIVFPRSIIRFKFMETILNTPHPDPTHPVSKRAWATISKQRPTEVTASERSDVVFNVLDNTKFSSEAFDVGVRELLHKNFLLDAYPLHDGPWEWPENPLEPLNDRQLLAEYWANFSMFLKEQPLRTIKHYFGYEVAIYFAWLGFYNKMLAYASIMGVIAFLSGCLFIHVYNEDHLAALCNHTGVMCSTILLDEYSVDNTAIGKAEKISSSCFSAYATYVNSNMATFLYSIAMVLWCTFFKEQWKRYLNIINAKWDTPDSEDFILRPQFKASNANNIRLHKYTGAPELYVPAFEQYCRYLLSGLITIIMIGLVIGTNNFIIMLEYYLLSIHFNRIAIIFITSFAALTSMFILEIVFDYNVLKFISRFEMPQTQLDYEKSIIAKSIVFLFFNSYGRLMYIAFFKGKLPSSHKQMPFEYCLPPSCEFEVIFLLALIVILKPIYLNLLPRRFFTIITQVKPNFSHAASNKPRWECDFELDSLDPRFILGEMNKLIIQFGLVTSFAASSPLIPLVALLYNLISLRLDATRFVKFYKRSVEKKHVTSIGLCFNIFETMCQVAIIINALYMAYTCKFAHMFYDYFADRSKIEDPVVYNEFTEISHYFDNGSCFVSGLYNGTSMSFTVEHYDLLAFKAYLALTFMLVGFVVSGFISYVIPDVPRELLEFIQWHEEKEKKKHL